MICVLCSHIILNSSASFYIHTESFSGANVVAFFEMANSIEMASFKRILSITKMIRLAGFNKLMNDCSYNFFCARGLLLLHRMQPLNIAQGFILQLQYYQVIFIKEIIERWDQINTFFKEPPKKYANSIVQARRNSGSSEMVILKI